MNYVILFLALAFPAVVFGAEFQPLTQIPGIEQAAQSETLPAFLNTVYQLCIGAAAVLAVLQIMRGGIMYMTGDSITEKKESRDIIVMSVVGLLLVLSPVIVFGIIDPRILSLQINFTQLQPSAGNSSGPPGEDDGPPGEDNGENAGGDTPQTPAEETEIPEEIIITPEDPSQPDNTIYAAAGTVQVATGGHYSSMRSVESETQSGGTCLVIQVTDYTNENRDAARERCQDRSGNYNLLKCIQTPGNMSVTRSNLCFVNQSGNARPLNVMRDSDSGAGN